MPTKVVLRSCQIMVRTDNGLTMKKQTVAVLLDVKVSRPMLTLTNESATHVSRKVTSTLQSLAATQINHQVTQKGTLLAAPTLDAFLLHCTPSQSADLV